MMLKTLMAQIKEFKWVSILTPVWMIGEVICEMIIPKLMGSLVDRGIEGGDLSYIFRTGLVMLVVALIGLLFGILGAFFGAKASAGFARNLRKTMFDHIQTFSFASIDRFSTSGLVTRLTTDVTNIQNAYQMILRMAMRAPASLVIALAMSFLISVKLSLVYLVAVFFLSLVMVYMMRTVGPMFQKVFRRYDELNESVQENVSAIRVVKAYVREDHEISRFEKAVAGIYQMFVQTEGKMVTIFPIMQGTVYVCILLISYYGAKMVVGGQAASSFGQVLTTGDLMSLLAYCMNILLNLMMLSMVFVMITMSAASARRIAEVIEEQSTMQNPENPLFVVADGSVTFDHVCFSYNKEAEEPVLQDISFHVNAGEMIGIIGGTGSSKSTLVSLISRLYDTDSGSVQVGGRDVREYDLEALRNQVSVVLQKNVLFSGTILENLRWGNKDAGEEECKRAARLACADEFIERMPEGYHTYIEQGGSNVSGGQRQRLCIARALLKKPKILILDDSTSAVDTATDARIRAALREEIADTTKFIIAQRISSVKDCDKIIVMDQGRIDGFDTHENLMEKNRIYREVYASQTGNTDLDNL